MSSKIDPSIPYYPPHNPDQLHLKKEQSQAVSKIDTTNILSKNELKEPDKTRSYSIADKANEEKTSDIAKKTIIQLEEADKPAHKKHTSFNPIKALSKLIKNLISKKPPLTPYQSFLKDLGLSARERNLIKNFTHFFNPQVLLDFIQKQDPSLERNEIKALYRTVVNAAKKTKNKSLLDLPLSGGKKKSGKSVKSYPYYLSIDKQLLVSLNFLGRGATKKASDGINLANGKELVKLTVLQNKKNKRDKTFEKLNAERELQSKLAKNNPDILPVAKIFEKRQKTNMIKKSGKKGHFIKFIYFDHKLFAESSKIDSKNIPAIYNASASILRGLAKMHEEGYVHMDVKPGNILLEDPAKGVIKIADFGGTKKSNEKITTFTLSYLPPESLIRKFFGSKEKKIEKSKKTPESTARASPSYDAYAAGLTMIDWLFPRLDTYCKKQYNKKGYSYLSAEEKEVIDEKLIKTISNRKIPPKEKEFSFKLLDIALGLIDSDPTKRMSCSTGYDDLKKSYPDLVLSPYSEIN